MACDVTVVVALLVLFCALDVIDASPRTFATDYLRKFGYMGAGAGDVRAAMLAFKTEVGLPLTDVVDRRTLRYMRQPRCGMTDYTIDGVDGTRRHKRFVASDEKWTRSTLTWQLNDPEHILKPYDRYVVRNTLHRAFGAWTDGTRSSLTFTEMPSDDAAADIIVFFARGEHNDSLPFDGKDGVVAHGFYPTNGNLHFDASENWTLNMGNGVNLYQTAVHEIGHLLGLHHSADRHAVMYPLNRPYNPAFALSDDDVRGIRYLYTPWMWHHYMRRYLLRWQQMQRTRTQ